MLRLAGRLREVQPLRLRLPHQQLQPLQRRPVRPQHPPLPWAHGMRWALVRYECSENPSQFASPEPNQDIVVFEENRPFFYVVIQPFEVPSLHLRASQSE